MKVTIPNYTYIFLTGLLLFSLSKESQAQNKETPNILCILVDDLGYGDLSCMGAKDMRTPNIDRFASEGLTFTNFYANSTVCSPSRASLLTGRYPDMVGVPGVIRQTTTNSWGYLNDNAVLMPELLKKKGYHTAIIGKWHLGLEEPNTPNGRGFDYFKGFLGDMMNDYWTHLRGGINWMRLDREVIDPEGHATDLFTDWSIDYLNKRKNDKKPFYLYLAYNAPHFPIQPPEEYYEQVKKREPQLSEKRAKNVAFVEHLDYSVGRVLSALKGTGLDENTLVVFTSDNGGALRYEQSNGKLRGGKQDMYEGGIRVPTFVNWKGKIKPGTSTDNIALSMDLFPTFCEVADVSIDHKIDGVSIVPTLLGQVQSTSDRTIFWVRREGGEKYGGQAYYAVRKGDIKILQNIPYEALQMFDMKQDELETTPLETSDNEVYKQLRKEWQEHIRLTGSVKWQNDNVKLEK
ncbi:MAG: sulfatase-like hydrolase/transferase [Cyclobacteriaceae bacterium]